MTPDINCETDVKHPKKDKMKKISENNERQVTGRNSKILSFKDVLLKLMFQGKLKRKLIIFEIV